MAGVLKIGLIGCGAIGSAIARHADKNPSMEVLYLLDNDMGKCDALSRKLVSSPKAVVRVADMEGVDVIVEAASQECVRERGPNALEKADLMVMSVGAFSDDKLLSEVLRKAEENGRKLYIPSGAIGGLDALKSASADKLDYVRLTTRKHPGSLSGAPWIAEKGIMLKAIKKPTVIFEGSARLAARWFPKNINVSVSLALAGIGLDRTLVRIIADPFTVANSHEVEAAGAFGKMTLRVDNEPFPQNKKTSRLAALSAIATLKGMASSLRVGT